MYCSGPVDDTPYFSHPKELSHKNVDIDLPAYGQGIFSRCPISGLQKLPM